MARPRSGSEGREGAGCAARWSARGSRGRAYQRVQRRYAPSDPGGNRVQKIRCAASAPGRRTRSPIDPAPDPIMIRTRYLLDVSSSHGNVGSHACAEPSIWNLAGRDRRAHPCSVLGTGGSRCDNLSAPFARARQQHCAGRSLGRLPRATDRRPRRLATDAAQRPAIRALRERGHLHPELLLRPGRRPVGHVRPTLRLAVSGPGPDPPASRRRASLLGSGRLRPKPHVRGRLHGRLGSGQRRARRHPDRLHGRGRQLQLRLDQGRPRQRRAEQGRAALPAARRRDQSRLAQLLRPRRQWPPRHPGLRARSARQPILPRGRGVRHPGRPGGRTGHRRGGHQPKLRQQRPAPIPERRQRPGNADALPVPRRPHRRLRPLPGAKRPDRAVSSRRPFRQRRQRLSQRHQRLERRPQQQRPADRGHGLQSRARAAHPPGRRPRQRVRRRRPLPPLPGGAGQDRRGGARPLRQMGRRAPLRRRYRRDRGQLGGRQLHLQPVRAGRHQLRLRPWRRDVARLQRLRLHGPHRRDALGPRAAGQLGGHGSDGEQHQLVPFAQQRHQLRHPQRLLGGRVHHLRRDTLPGRHPGHGAVGGAQPPGRRPGPGLRSPHPERDQAGADGRRAADHPERPAAAAPRPRGATRDEAAAVAGQPEQRHRRYPHQLVDAVRLRAAGRGRGDGDGHERTDPPTADIIAPQWYSYIDPTVTPTLEVDGSLARSRFNSGGSVRYVLEWALGADPADGDFHAVASAAVGTGISGKLGTIHLSQVPPSFYTHAPLTTLQPDGAEQYTMTIRLRVNDANGLKAEDRRSVGLRHDPDLLPGYPKSVDWADGDAAPTYADLEGTHELDLIVPNGNGEVNVCRPDGTEVPGFPVHTVMLKQLDPLNPENYRARAYRNTNLANVQDPLSGGAAVGDLFHNGELEIVTTSTNRQAYVWDSHGRPLPGFPVGQDPANWVPFAAVPTPRAATGHSRNPDRGNWSPPVLADLEGTGQLDIPMTAFDGFVYAFRPDGTTVPGWPVEIELPASYFTDHGGTVDPGSYIRDAKLMYPVTVADVLELGHPQVFVPSFESNGHGSSTEDLATSLLGFNPSNDAAATWLYGLYADGNDHPGGPYIHPPDGIWPVTVQSTSFTYDQSIDFVGESTSPPVVADFGSGPRIITGPITGGVYSINPDGSIDRRFDLSCPHAEGSSLP